MFSISLIIIVFLLYVYAGILPALRMWGKIRPHKVWVFAAGLCAIFLHAILLHRWIDVSMGQNLAFFNVFSQIAWLISLLIVLVAFVKPRMENLGIIVFPIAGVSVLLVWLFPGSHIINTWAAPKELVHVLLAFLTFSVLAIAATQALLLTVQERLLHNPRFVRTFPVSMLQVLPPLEIVERVLFQTISLGFLLLSILTLSSFYFFPGLLFEKHNLHHSLLAIMAWLVFAVLLGGRKLFGWRGQTAINWTFIGMFLLILSYFGSGLLLV